MVYSTLLSTFIHKSDVVTTSTDEDLQELSGAIVLVAKCPIPGKSKTRLSKLLGDDGSAFLAKSMLSDVLEVVGRCATLDSIPKILLFAPGTPWGANEMGLLLSSLPFNFIEAQHLDITLKHKNQDPTATCKNTWILLPMMSSSSNASTESDNALSSHSNLPNNETKESVETNLPNESNETNTSINSNQSNDGNDSQVSKASNNSEKNESKKSNTSSSEPSDSNKSNENNISNENDDDSKINNKTNITNEQKDLTSSNLGLKLTDALIQARSILESKSNPFGIGNIVFLGMDSPMIPLSEIIYSLSSKRTIDAVHLCPAQDGGYGMLSVPHSIPPNLVFRGVRWSHPLTAISQLKALTDCCYEMNHNKEKSSHAKQDNNEDHRVDNEIIIRIGKMMHDVDEPDDLWELAELLVKERNAIRMAREGIEVNDLDQKSIESDVLTELSTAATSTNTLPTGEGVKRIISCQHTWDSLLKLRLVQRNNSKRYEVLKETYGPEEQKDEDEKKEVVVDTK